MIAVAFLLVEKAANTVFLWLLHSEQRSDTYAVFGNMQRQGKVLYQTLILKTVSSL